MIEHRLFDLDRRNITSAALLGRSFMPKQGPITFKKKKKSKIVVNPMVWRCREFFFSKIFVFFNLCSTRFFSNFNFWGHFSILRHRKVM